MNRPAYPQGSLTAEDARFIRQDDAVEARTIRTVRPNCYRDLLAVKNARMKRKARVQEAVLIVAGGLLGAFCFLFVLPIVLVAFGA